MENSGPSNAKPWLKCAVPENIHTLPRKVNGNSNGERGFKNKIFYRKVGSNTRIFRGVGISN